jgi:hypothetical protein
MASGEHHAAVAPVGERVRQALHAGRVLRDGPGGQAHDNVADLADAAHLRVDRRSGL